MLGRLGMVLVVGLAIGASAGAATRKEAKPEAAETKGPDGGKVNKCGCYLDSSNACLCLKKAVCGCPGECEPRGCEEKRAKEIEREMEEEVKRAREAEKKQQDERAAKENAQKEQQPAEESDEETE